MMTDIELHHLLNDFLSDSTTDNDEQFVQSVMLSLPPEPRFGWVKDVFPAVVFFCTMMTVWKLNFLTPAVLMTFATDGFSYLQAQWHMISPSSSTALLTAVGLIVCCYAYETFIEI